MADPATLTALAADVTVAAQAHHAAEVARTASTIAGASAVPARVVVVGDFKRGKSSLVNGLLAADVVPVEDTTPTRRPVVVTGGTPSARLIRAGDEGPVTEEIHLSDLGSILAGIAPVTGDGLYDDVARVELTLEARVLQRGFSIVDCPPATPSQAAALSVTLDLAAAASVAVFVTDATQPLTASELACLRAISEIVPATIVAVAKSDLAPHGAAVIQTDRRALETAGLGCPVMAVSNELRRLAVERADSKMNDESGFPELVRAIDQAVAEAAVAGRRRQAETLAAAARSLDEILAARQESLASGDSLREERVRTEADLRMAERQRSGGANWQRVISEAFVDIQTESGHVLNEGIKALMIETERHLADLDPAKEWDAFEAWVRNSVAERIEASFDDADRRTASAVDAAVAEFADADLDLGHTSSSASAAAAIELAAIAMDGDMGGRESRIGGGITGMRGLYTGPMMLGLLGQAGISAAMLTALAPVGMVLGVGLGAKAIRDDRTRQVEARRRKALASARAYIDLASGRARKEFQNYLRAQQRAVRSALLGHADGLVEQAQARLAALDEQIPSPSEVARHQAVLVRDRERLAALMRQIEALASEGVG